MKKTTGLLLVLLCWLTSACTSGFESRFNNLMSNSSTSEQSQSEGKYTLDDLQRFDKGVTLYSSKSCVTCHGDILTSAKRATTGSAILSAIDNFSSMSNIELNQEEAEWIAYALRESRERILAGLESESEGAPTTPPPPTPVISYNEKSFSCDNENNRGKSDIGMQRLTKVQLINTWTDAFGSDVVDKVTTLVRLSSEFEGPDEYEKSPFMDKSQVEALFIVAQEMGIRASENPTSLGNIDACLKTELNNSSLTDNCMNKTIPEIGQRLFRRPLSSEEVDKFKAAVKSMSGLNAKSQIALLISRLLVTPQAHFIFPNWTQDIDGRKVVDWATVIQRLSFGITDGPPDQELMSKYSQMSDIEVVKEQAQRLAKTPRGRAKYRKIMKGWLRLDEAVEVGVTPAKEFGIEAKDTKAILEEMKTEALDFAEYIAFDHPGGTVEDLLTQPLGFPKSEPLRKILGASALSTNGKPVSAPQHLGVLNRPALLADSSQKGNVIHRGLNYRLHFLCDEFNDDDIPDDINESFEKEAQKLDFYNSSAREIAYAGTSSSNCIGCHQTINSIGYALGNFGPLGQYQTEERVFDADGKFLRTLPIDNTATDTNIISTGETVQGHVELANKMAASYKFKACFSRNILRRTRGRTETGWDNCQLAELEEAMHNKETLIDVYLKSIVSEDIFWKGL